MSNLVIVESPAKAKTIKKFLGKGYEIVASMGHVRDLPKKRLGVNIKKNFEPSYAVIDDKKKIVEELKEKAKKCAKIFLATDPDREGEAISWHLAHILGLDLNENNRIVFNEITQTGICGGIENPRMVNLNLVDSQQARRILDRLLGFKLSPFLSQKIHKGLSAGRVQSVAVRIIVDRENEIRSFKPVEYWTIEADLLPKGSRKSFIANFHGTLKKKIEINNKEESDKILANLDGKEYKIAKIKKGKRNKSPAPPFITSTLQQEASKKLGFQAKRTMRVAQELYEGLEIESIGAIGLITYMRTDSLRISEEARKQSQELIVNTWGKKYLPSSPRYFKSKANSQDGHEAIRPSTPELTPEKVKKSLSSDQFKLYKLIWERFLASQMANCVQNTTQTDITAGDYLFKASGYIVTFDGFTVLYADESDSDESKTALPELDENTVLKLKKLESKQHFTEPPPRYNEASLIKALEEYGIGRPSTYASTISTITIREYVVRENKNFKPTELGEVVTDLLKKEFAKIVNLKFTAQMEDDLDTIEIGEKAWLEVIKGFYDEFVITLEKAKEKMKDVKIKLEEDKTDLICDLCGKPMVIKYGKFGKFIGCSSYPDCKNIKAVSNEIGVKCPKCEGEVIKRKTKKGRFFYGCNKYPNCDFISWDEPLNENCPQCGKILYKKNNKKALVYCAFEDCKFTSEEDKNKKI